jgi:mono/diheme cytochrome c family protein
VGKVPRVIGTIAFVLAFVVIALGVLFAAMRGGRRRCADAARRPESRGSRRAWGVGLPLAMLVIGVGVPLLVLSVNGNSHAEKGPAGVDLTSAQATGRELFAKNCATCHTLRASDAVGKVGPDLDQLRPPAGLTLDAIKNGRARGNGQMPRNLLQGQDAKDVASYVAAVAGREQ